MKSRTGCRITPLISRRTVHDKKHVGRRYDSVSAVFGLRRVHGSAAKRRRRKNIHYFLTRNRLNNSVSYQDLSLSVSDVAVLKNVSVRLQVLPGLANKTEEFVIHNYKESGHIATKLSFSAENISFRLVDIARILKKSDESVIDSLALFNPAADILNYPLYAVMLAGCNNVSAGVKGEYTYYPTAKK